MSNATVFGATLVAAGYNKSTVLEQITNYVLTSQGVDAAGVARTGKYVNLSPTYDVPTYGASAVALGLDTPVEMEDVGNAALY